jgi:hypothetical protein
VATPEEVFRDAQALRNMQAAGALRQPQPAPATPDFQAPCPSPTLERTAAAGTQPAPLSHEILPNLGEGVGAAGGATLGGMAGGIPGAVIGGAGGARLGRAGGNILEGQPAGNDVGAAGVSGALGGLAGPATRLAGRLLAQVPSAGRAVAQAEREAMRRGSAAAVSKIDTELGHLEAQARDQAAREANLRGEPGSPFNPFADVAADAAKARLQELRAQIADPERAVERARAKVTAANGPSGSMGIALGAVLGHLYGGLEATIGTGALGFALARIENRLAVRLANSPEFVRWATGLQGKTITDAVASFATDRKIHSTDPEAADSFAGELMDLATGALAGSYVTGATGSTALGLGAGAAAHAGMAEARGLADDLLRAGERTWNELVGNAPADQPQAPLR